MSAQAQAGETVSITVTKPDSSIEVLTAQTLADKSYSVSKEYVVAGAYKAKAHGDADSQFTSWDREVSFTLHM